MIKRSWTFRSDCSTPYIYIYITNQILKCIKYFFINCESNFILNDNTLSRVLHSILSITYANEAESNGLKYI